MSKFNISTDGSTLTVAPVGKIDSYNAPTFHDAVMKELPGKTSAVFDFSRLEYISSAGLRVLLATKKELGNGEVRVRNVPPTIKDILNVTRLAQFVVIE